MGNSTRSLGQRIIHGCSRLLLWVGAAIFLVGGKVLYEIKHTTFAVAETYGIVGGVLLMSLGAGVAFVGVKDPGTQTRS